MSAARKRIRKPVPETVAMSTRFQVETYNFLRDQAHVQRKAMNLIIEECVQRYKKMLTSPNDMV